ncbi:MAG: hypothetical protein II073_09645 [Lachnospiraceae bacterium]|nr:hypothetical protein [Lachnospiraceae bacterium]
MKNKTMTYVLVMLVLVIAVGLGFWNLMEQKRGEESLQKQSNDDEIEFLLKKDFENNYPQTPREVLKFYSRINSCLYNKEMSQSEFEQLVDKMRLLFDTELLEKNEKKTQLRQLLKDRKSFKKEKKTISTYTIDINSSVVKKKKKGRYYASLRASYLVQQGNKGSYSKTNENFLLRQNDDGKWKILGWKIIEQAVEE